MIRAEDMEHDKEFFNMPQLKEDSVLIITTQDGAKELHPDNNNRTGGKGK
ncbi:hypothetical protein ACFL3V_04170 [Nanoarchaeota archaeon]